MKYKVFIVDDEKMIRDGLIQELPWDDLNLELCGSAEDGEMALEAMTGEYPDIIISDIRMPFMDGLELMQKVQKLSPDTRFIFISGHDEFSYAQQAIKLGAYDYILKPLEVSYLVEILNKLISEISEKETTQLHAQKGLPALKRDIIRNLLFRNNSTDQTLKDLESINIQAPENVCVIIAQIDDFYLHTYEMEPDEMKEILRTFYDFMNLKAQEWKGIEIAGSHQEAILVLEGKSKEFLMSAAATVFEARREWISNGPTISVGVGRAKRKLKELSESYEEARKALEYKFLQGSERIFYYDDILKTESEEFHYQDDLQCVYESLEIGNKDEINTQFLLLKKNMLESGFSRSSFQIFVSDLFLKIVREISKAGGSMDQLYLKTEEVYKGMLAHDTAEGSFNDLHQFLLKAVDFLRVKRDGKYDSVIQRATSFIKKNFSRSTLSLDEIAQEANMSSCYFSVIFKRETGKTPIEYITDTRMTEAGKLLMGKAMKAYEVSYAVGYENPTYFSNVFKKHYHITPSEYRSRKN